MLFFPGRLQPGRRSVLTIHAAALLVFALGATAAQPSPGQPAHPAAPAHSVDPWWKHALIYEIYPALFQDSNGDGLGDLNGITQRMNYLQKLGLDAIWIAPMYWARVAPNGKAVLVAMNFSNRPKSIVVDLARAAINGKTADTLATSTPSLQGRISLHEITLPPYTSWLGSVH